MTDRALGALLAFVLCLAVLAVNASRSEYQAERVYAEQGSQKAIGNQEAVKEVSQQTKPSSAIHGDDKGKRKEAEEDGTEFLPPLFGFRLKITDTLLVIFTAVLAWKTAGLDKSTQRLWVAGESALKATERAFVFAEECSYELTTFDMNQFDRNITLRPGLSPELFPTRFAFQPKWRNSGNAPTANLFTRVDWSIGGLREIGTYRAAPAPLFIGPQSTGGGEFFEVPNLADVIQNGMPGIMEPIQEMFVWGRADYEDIFGRKHFVEWCYRVRPFRLAGERLRVNFIPSGPYNRTDRDTQEE